MLLYISDNIDKGCMPLLIFNDYLNPDNINKGWTPIITLIMVIVCPDTIDKGCTSLITMIKVVHPD